MDSKNKITATVCIYSGRPNPQWNIGLKEYNKLLRFIEHLPGTDPQSQPSLLGYSGILVVAGTISLYVFKEIITMTGEKLEKGYVDTNRILERQLLQSAPALIQVQLKGIIPVELI